MPHFRQEPLFQKHYETIGSESFTHTYKGKDYKIDRGFEDTLSPELLQSISTRLKNEYPEMQKPKQVKVKSEGPSDKNNKKSGENKRPGFDNRSIKKIVAAQIIRNELLRLSKVDAIVEDKLDYPKVFRRLLSEPHMALYETKKIVEEKHHLYLFVDQAVGYNYKDQGFHNTIIEEAKKIKGIHIFYGNGLRVEYKGKTDYYWNHLSKIVPKGKKVLAISQGCGGTLGDPPKGYDLHFATHFCKGNNCGCNTIFQHEHHKIAKMHYGIDSPEKLKLLKL
jgi:hypothetical protein